MNQLKKLLDHQSDREQLKIQAVKPVLVILGLLAILWAVLIS
ncbi:hypothetical protein ADIAL_1149 [Alkalibacterium sp. AK22]|nr:hypothetical protein [Alkalibacterium sp. AK22]EXJ23391.1 hypothetical protein ADIAL_1149 [Alkalibacterium sp. AK22]